MLPSHDIRTIHNTGAEQSPNLTQGKVYDVPCGGWGMAEEKLSLPKRKPAGKQYLKAKTSYQMPLRD